MNGMKAVCELINISKSYGDHRVLNNLSMTVGEGEMVAIMGKSGSGKTTILNMMGLLEKPDSGTIKLFGEKSPRIGSAKAYKLLRTRLAYLFQNGALIDDETVDYNLEVPLLYVPKTKREKQEMKTTVLKKMGLSISLKQKIYELSGGEQQRVAIARILLKSCDLIFADEPTGSLDSDNRNEIMRILKDLNEAGKTIIIVTHDQYVAEACDRTIKLA
ncbi:putative ABC transport system ATP-binding protein [Desulfitobacterium sp. LBE]|uniref:ABC transporter ATP-binding protein n=1 Tax=Desulfitobacterium sp. LBE TaxID=884086 RepID=UPI00119AA0BF|nr:ABC transporter ATP-binding protein [Desulfitobacterium sp. LBE]TWH55979.1 putative ABC transport system ATP-binding protein [Desulfitobacterium sp. LBE]